MGEGVTGWKAGDGVTAETTVRTCGSACPAAAAPQPLLPEGDLIHPNRCLALTPCRADRLYALPDEVDFINGAMTNL